MSSIIWNTFLLDIKCLMWIFSRKQEFIDIENILCLDSQYLLSFMSHHPTLRKHGGEGGIMKHLSHARESW